MPAKKFCSKSFCYQNPFWYMLPRTLRSHTWLISSKFFLQNTFWVCAIHQSYMSFVLFPHQCEVKYKLRSPPLLYIFLNSLGFISSSIYSPQETNLLHKIPLFQKSLTMILQYSYDGEVSRFDCSVVFLKTNHGPKKVEKLGKPQHTIGLAK